VEKVAKNGQMVQNSQPLSPGEFSSGAQRSENVTSCSPTEVRCLATMQLSSLMYQY